MGRATAPLGPASCRAAPLPPCLRACAWLSAWACLCLCVSLGGHGSRQFNLALRGAERERGRERGARGRGAKRRGVERGRARERGSRGRCAYRYVEHLEASHHARGEEGLNVRVPAGTAHTRRHGTHTRAQQRHSSGHGAAQGGEARQGGAGRQGRQVWGSAVCRKCRRQRAQACRTDVRALPLPVLRP
jgi:hypothetical protein